MQLEYAPRSDWPALSWLARCRSDGGIVVSHGLGVETRPDWFCEAVWVGDFGSGDFDHTDIVFGSGGRVRGGRVTFVSSAATVDRLHSLNVGSDTIVSNSLPCLLAATGSELDPTYGRYVQDLASIKDGIDQYVRTLETSSGPLHLTYFRNLQLTASGAREVGKPDPDRGLGTFARYRAFLASALAALARNASDADRRRPYLLLTTISSGYDSPTVAALAREAGLTEAISFRRARLGYDDSGRAIAERLGLQVTEADRDAWRSARLPEVPFLAVDGCGEDVYFKGAEHLLRGRVLLTGFHGDRMWDTKPRDLSPQVRRSDRSGLSLSEYRLLQEFIHCPVPFIGVRQIAAVNAISHSPELTAWRVPGRYSRPICRRIDEGAGVPRTQFGVTKKAASVLIANSRALLTPGSMRDFTDWLRDRAPAALSQSRGFAPLVRGAACTTAALLERSAGVTPKGERILRETAGRVSMMQPRHPLHLYLFPWAIDHARRRYGG